MSGAQGVQDNGATQTTKKYYSIAGMRVAMDDGTDLVYFASDHLSSTSIVMSDTGTLLSEQRYLPFGGVRGDVGTLITETDFGYTGQRDMGGMGLMDYNARFYSPLLGRFVQPDTIIPNPGDSQAWNRYSYVGNNPVNRIDPSGHVDDPSEGSGGCANDPDCIVRLRNIGRNFQKCIQNSEAKGCGRNDGNNIVAAVCGTNTVDSSAYPHCVTPDEGEITHLRNLDEKGAEKGFDIRPVHFPGSFLEQAEDINELNTDNLICYSGGVAACLLYALLYSKHPENLRMVLIGGAYYAPTPEGAIGLESGPPGYENGFVGIINHLADQGANILVIWDGNMVDTTGIINPRDNVQAVESPENHFTVDNPDSSMWEHIFQWFQDPSYPVPTHNYWE